MVKIIIEFQDLIPDYHYGFSPIKSAFGFLPHPKSLSQGRGT
jgi:hypothetical protein